MSESDLYSQGTVELHVTENHTIVQPRIHYLEFSAAGPQGPQGPPGSPGGSRYIHTQDIPASVWSVQHNLGYEPLFATVTVNDEDVTWAVDIVHADLNNLTVQFSQPTTGKAAFL